MFILDLKGLRARICNKGINATKVFVNEQNTSFQTEFLLPDADSYVFSFGFQNAVSVNCIGKTFALKQLLPEAVVQNLFVQIIRSDESFFKHRLVSCTVYH